MLSETETASNKVSLSSGDFATYEGLASWAYNFVAGLGNVEYSLTVGPLPGYAALVSRG